MGFIISVGLVLTLPLIVYGFPFYSSDIHHVIWYSHFSSQLWAGEFYPRWLIGMNGGLGAPTFFYYAPVPYYLTALFKPFFAQDTLGWHQLGVSTSIALAASGVCAYLWLIKIATQKAAFVAALIYMAMPYHLATDIYDRGAFGEIWTFVWMPLILLFTEAISRGSKPAVLGLVVSYALLIMTQLPTTLMFSLVPLCYGCYLAGRNRLRMAAIMLGAMSLSIGLSAIYLLPALAMQKYVFMEDLTAGFYYYGHWFLPLKPDSNKPGPNTIAAAVTQVAILGSFAYLLARRATDSTARKRAAFWMVVLLLSVFIMVPLSSFVWQLITPLQMIQFPFRFSTVLCVAATALLALGMSSAKENSLSAGLISWLALLMIIGWLGYAVLWARSGYGTSDFSPATVLKPTRRQELVNSDANEFRPRWVVSLQEPGLESLLGRIGESADGLSKVKIVEGTGNVDVKSWKPREIAFQVDTPTGAVLQVSQFYFPGWSAYTTDEPCSLKVEPSKPGGLVRVSVPGGSHRVMLLLNQTLPEYAGQLISAASATLLVVMVGLSAYWRKDPICKTQ
ncbi:MAG: 6-pyruvoyl-tetrahydropterin synthase-related protein [Pyrinomonadaceae bacterium]